MPTPDKAIDPIEEYLAKIEKQLRRRLPAWMVEQRLLEAREHLTQRAEELVTEGVEPAQAQATAVSSFGPAKEWAKSVAEAAYTDAGAIKARRVAFAAAAFIIFLMLAEMIFQFAHPLNRWSFAIAAWTNDLIAVAACVLAVASLRGRRAERAVIGGMGAVAALVAFFYFGSSWIVPPDHSRQWQRADLARLISGLDREIPDTRRDLALLALGIKTYSKPGGQISDSDIPPALRTANGRYIAPRAMYRDADGSLPGMWPTTADTMALFSPFIDYSWSAWQPYLTSFANVDIGLQLKQKIPYHSAATAGEAEGQWRDFGPIWVKIEQTMLANRVQMLDRSARLEAQQPEFVWQNGLPWASEVATLALAALLLDSLAAFFGRWAFRRRRAPLRQASG